ncbi:MAG TPA: hypothetical protein VLL74_00090 [Methanoregula sp.]|nr:hypothetical protein [Methanoregula sp.]
MPDGEDDVRTRNERLPVPAVMTGLSADTVIPPGVNDTPQACRTGPAHRPEERTGGTAETIN